MKQFEIRFENDNYIIYDTQLCLDEPLPLAKISFDSCNQSVMIIPIEEKFDGEEFQLYDASKECGEISIDYQDMHEREFIQVHDNKTKKKVISQIIGYLNYWKKREKTIGVELSYSE